MNKLQKIRILISILIISILTYYTITAENNIKKYKENKGGIYTEKDIDKIVLYSRLYVYSMFLPGLYILYTYIFKPDIPFFPMLFRFVIITIPFLISYYLYSTMKLDTDNLGRCIIIHVPSF